MSFIRRINFVVAVSLACALTVSLNSYLRAQSIDPPFNNDYSIRDLGTPTGVPSPLGGLTLLAGDPNTMLIGGSANNPTGAIYAVEVSRDSNNHITGFVGTATLYATAPNIDGGLAYGDDDVLFFTRYPNNSLGQIRPGSNSPDKLIDLSALGVVASVGSVNFVAPGFPGAGEIRLASYNGGGFYSGTLTPDGNGTFDLSNVALEAQTGGGPEGMVWVPAGAPVFSAPSMLFSEYAPGRIAAYELDVNGIPLPATRRIFISGLAGAEGAFIDPLTGDFMFSTYGGGDRVIAVCGFGLSALCATSGTLIEGVGQQNNFTATCASDNVRWAAHGATFVFQVNDPVAQFELKTTAVTTQPCAFNVEIEASKQNNNGNLNLRVLLFNFNTQQYVAMPGVMPLTTTDTTHVFRPAGGSNFADFIEPNTLEVRVLLQTIQTSGFANVRTQLDQVIFKVN